MEIREAICSPVESLACLTVAAECRKRRSGIYRTLPRLADGERKHDSCHGELSDIHGVLVLRERHHGRALRSLSGHLEIEKYAAGFMIRLRKVNLRHTK
jgi:hypothetical protein